LPKISYSTPNIQKLKPFMASEQQIKRYLAYWLQLGKKVVIRNGDLTLQPQSVIAGARYSDEFESIWQQILSPESGDCYLEGTTQTIGELLTPRWNLDPCARCDMPVPVINIGMPPELCPCNDLPLWPNTDIPAPREPVRSHERLREIRDRLHKTEGQREPQQDLSDSPNTETPTPGDAVNSQGRLSEIRDRLQKANRH
jgi:hypothetical protein